MGRSKFIDFLWEPQGCIWTITLWISACANTTMLFGLPNELTAKHVTLTVTVTAWVASFFFYLTKLDQFGNKNISKQTYVLIAAGSLLANLVAALCLAFIDADQKDSELPVIPSNLKCFAITEILIVCAGYAAHMYLARETLLDGFSTLKSRIMCEDTQQEESLKEMSVEAVHLVSKARPSSINLSPHSSIVIEEPDMNKRVSESTSTRSESPSTCKQEEVVIPVSQTNSYVEVGTNDVKVDAVSESSDNEIAQITEKLESHEEK